MGESMGPCMEFNPKTLRTTHSHSHSTTHVEEIERPWQLSGP